MTKTSLISLLAIGAVLAVLPAAASARSNYCSASGDVCYGVVNSSPVKLQIRLAAKYFSRYRLCITGPHGERECHRFRIHRLTGGVFGSTVSWPKHYRYDGKGTYHARWFQGGHALGPRVSF